MFNFVSAFVVVYLLLFLANRFGPRVSGIINGIPLIAGISYVLLALEQGALYSSLAAVENALGVNISLMTLCFYFWTRHKKLPILVSWILCCMLFVVLSLFISQFDIHSIVKIFVGFVGLLGFYFALRTLPEVKVNMPKARQSQIVFRSFLGAALIWAVALAGNYLPDVIAGKLVALPIPALAIMIALEKDKGVLAINSFLKITPFALSINAFYTTLIWCLYPLLGVLQGTLIAYAAIIPIIWFSLQKDINKEVL